ncbi:hypothetical protein [Pseudomonas koreensis]|uniref:hypothetical protein n=1 Tax=Pseudomonas koreensis TaxID=198620 RepID=UPI00164359B6|nr:hypothetical protein [Pseudomonas koreensis]
MAFFSPLFNQQLFTAVSGKDYLFLVLPAPTPLTGIELADALNNIQLCATFVFSAGNPGLTAQNAATFVEDVLGVVRRAGPSRGIVWLRDPLSVTDTGTALLGLDPGGKFVTNALDAPLLSSFSLTVDNGAQVALSDDAASLKLSAARIRFSNLDPALAAPAEEATIPCTGTTRGVIGFWYYIQRQALHDIFSWGLQFAIAPPADSDTAATALWLPLASGNLPSATDQIGFDATIDPSDPLNQYADDRTALYFNGVTLNPGRSETVLVSNYSTPSGQAVFLHPLKNSADTARLVFMLGSQPDSLGHNAFQLAPVGDFALSVPDAPQAATQSLMCGFLGTEYLVFRPGSQGNPADRLRFLQNQCAFAERFPFAKASPVGPPLDPDAPLLSASLGTSWVTLLTEQDQPGGDYVCQPKGATLYGRDAMTHHRYPQLFGAMEPGITLAQSTAAFPLAPYAGVSSGDGVENYSSAQIIAFEQQVLGPLRSERLSGEPKVAVNRAMTALAPTGQQVMTTPMGLLATIESDGRWSKILLGKNFAQPAMEMAFLNPTPLLQQAFQTPQQFMVIANSTQLGGSAFGNSMNIESWNLQADVGRNGYDDYRNVMIIKGRQGALFDPSSDATRAASLLSSPDQWTQGNVFAAPSDVPPGSVGQPPGPPDVMELVTLSFWLQRYFEQAAADTDGEYFEHFNRIARDPNWTGILILRVDTQLPKDLAGMAAGMTTPENFVAHHFGIEISQVQNDPQATQIALQSSSSMFGLIHYVDPDFVAPAAGEPVQPLPPPAGADYDFRVLTLKVLFANTAIKNFESYSQITLNRLFGTPVSRMGNGGNPYNAIVLSGTYQNNNGQPVYSLSSQDDSTFYLNSNVINKIEITNAQMTTRNATAGQISSWIGLQGFIDFKAVTFTPPADGEAPATTKVFDVFSFGSPAGTDNLRQGLSFNNLGLLLDFPGNAKEARTLTFVSKDIRFDLTNSTPRADSLFSNFALQLQGLVSGDEQHTPGQAGYLPVIPDAPFGGVDGGNWYGLQLQVNMGTPGALAGNVGLTSTLLVAWSSDSTGDDRFKASIGIQLPGTGGGARLISLQSVLKLSIGQIRLGFDADRHSFLLQLTDIALKFFGLLKIPPGGSTLFYLFGNPQSDGKPSGLGWYAMYRKDADKALVHSTTLLPGDMQDSPEPRDLTGKQPRQSN